MAETVNDRRIRRSNYNNSSSNFLAPETMLNNSRDAESQDGEKKTKALSSQVVIGRVRLFIWRYRILIGSILAVCTFFIIKSTLEDLFLDPCATAQKSIEEFGSAQSTDFPKIIHQQWKNEQIPDKYKGFRSKWKELFGEEEYTHMLWTDDSARDLLKKYYPWFLKAFDGFKHNIQRADSIRYFILYHYGGIYADLDYEPLHNFWKALPKDKPSFVESPYKYNENAQNSLMAGPKGHPFWKVIFDIMLERQSYESVLSSTGPAMLDEAFRRSVKNNTNYYILPCENFHRIPFGSAGEGSPFMSRLGREVFGRLPIVKQCGHWQNKNDCQYGIHHNAVSWAAETIV